MERRRFGRSDLEGSILGLGGLHFGVFLDQVGTTELIHQALDAGITTIDTAPPYGRGRSEELIGSAVKGRRHRVILTTKVGLTAAAGADGAFRNELLPLTSSSIRLSLEASLTALQTDYVDLYQLHACDPSSSLDEVLGTLHQLIGEGKIRHYGCSNHDPDELAAVLARAAVLGIEPPLTAQVQYNLLERRVEREMAPLCGRAEVGMICNRALARGVLSGQYVDPATVPAASRAAVSERLKRALDATTLRLVRSIAELASAAARSPAEVALAWLAGRPAVTTIVVGVRSPVQLNQCIQGVMWRLPAETDQALEQLVDEAGLRSRVDLSPTTFFER